MPGPANVEFVVTVNETAIQKFVATNKGVALLLERTGKKSEAALARGFGREFESQIGRLIGRMRELAAGINQVNIRGRDLVRLGTVDLAGARALVPGGKDLRQNVSDPDAARDAIREQFEGAEQEFEKFIARAGVLNEDFIRQFVDSLPPLESALVSAFRGFGQRFRATLQFAISGAIIFAFQRLVREAFETAIEVERAFEDIASALEFDVPFERGTPQFEQALEKVRVEALAVADEFNELPTVVNRIAFQMVARFRDAENAIAATRAQILALKVSTIDAEEILRALTATAESFALATLEVNANLSLQERVLQRENAAVGIYTEALDLATVIQQTWGIQLEDTIEGTGRAAESFRQAGFTMAETSAIVASAVFQLGLPGIQVAEKLNRSLIQITSPAIRDQLLDLAVASKAFFLTFADFDSASTALDTISEQFASIQNLEPATAIQIAQIIGQRRETEVVTAVLANTDFRDSIIQSADEAAGAAENRFSFLQETLREILNSIAAQFQELVQNLEKLGALSPFKVILQSIDLLLGGLNELLRSLNGIFNAFANIPILGKLFSDNLLPQIIAVVLALKLAKRTLEAFTFIAVLGAGVAKAKGIVQGVVTAAAPGIGAAAGGAAIGAGFASDRAASSAVAAAAGASAVAMQKLNIVLGKFGLFINGIGQAFLRMKIALQAGVIALLSHSAAVIRDTVVTNFRVGVGFVKKLSALALGGRAAAAGGVGVAAGTGAGVAGAAITAQVAGWILIVGKFVDTILTSGRELKKMNETLADANREIDRAVTRGELTPIQEDIRRAQAQIGATEALQPFSGTTAAVTNVLTSGLTAGLGETIFGLFNDEFQQTINNPAEVKRLLELQGVGDTWLEQIAISLLPLPSRRVLIPLSEENVRARTAKDFQDDLGPALQVGFREKIDQFAGNFGPELTEGLLFFAKQLERDLRNATTSEEIEAAREAYSSFTQELEDQVIAAGADAAGLEITLNTARAAIEEITRNLAIGGRTTPEQAIRDLEKQRELLATEAENLRKRIDDPESQLKAAEFEKEADAVLVQQGQIISEEFDRRRTLIGLLVRDDFALQQQIKLFKQEIKRLEDAGLANRAREVGVELIQAEQTLIKLFQTQIEAVAALRQQYARTAQQRLDIQRQLAKDLLRLGLQEFARAALGDGSFALAEQLIQASVEATAISARMAEDIGRTGIVATARQAGPILNKLVKINSELAGLQFDLARLPEESNEWIAVMIQIAENQAAASQNLLRNAASAALLQAGVNDSILELKARISILAAEIELTGRLVGINTAEYNDLKRAQDALQLQLANAILELRDLNRRLDSDVTNAFEQAQIDLIAILEKLAAPDLGELEEARLTLERKNAEAAAKRAFFDDKLFNLKFLFDTGEIGLSAYINALEALLATVDTSTDQGKKIFSEIQGIIDGLTDSINTLAFNIPGAIRLPTLFEVRRSLAADQLGVNYQDNREQQINVFVSDDVDLVTVIEAIESAFGDTVEVEAARSAQGAAGISIGAF